MHFPERSPQTANDTPRTKALPPRRRSAVNSAGENLLLFALRRPKLTVGGATNGGALGSPNRFPETAAWSGTRSSLPPLRPLRVDHSNNLRRSDLNSDCGRVEEVGGRSGKVGAGGVGGSAGDSVFAQAFGYGDLGFDERA